MSFQGRDVIDLSIGLESGVDSEPFPPEIAYRTHEDGAERLAEHLRDQGFEVEAEDFPDGHGLASEDISAIPHTGTHMDAPWHYGPEVDGTPAKTIDEIPIEWCIGEAVILDFTWKEPRTEISKQEIKTELEEVNHELSSDEMVFIETGADELWGSKEYLTEFPGMGAEATKYIVDQGVKIIGTDAYGFDKPFVEMAKRFVDSGNSSELWPAHFAGREVEYCQIEKMANLDQLPQRTGVSVTAQPISIENASGAWVRPIAHIEVGQ